MTIRTYPSETKNPNVPEKVFLVAEFRNGVTAYIDEDGFLYEVAAGDNCNPRSCSLSKFCKYTGDTLSMLVNRYNQWLDNKKEE